MSWLLIPFLASHFSMVGFPTNTESAEALEADIGVYAQTCDLVPIDGSDHLCRVRDETGAEMWIGLKKKGETFELATVNPALRGEGRIPVVVDGDVSDPQWKTFERRLQVSFSDLEVPMIVDLADPREAARFSKGSKLVLDVSAFADEIAVHDTEAAYSAAQANREFKLASDHFIPSGMFADEKAEKALPTAHAMFAGRILRQELRRNTLGKSQYWWFLVETLGGVTINVVADPAMVTTAPKVGGYLAGSFWLSARIAT